MAVALLALFVALGGSAVAVSGKINGKTIKRGSVPGNRIKRDTLTGRQIREATLGIVPRSALATAASNAAHADSSDKLGSLTSADFQKAGTVVPFNVRLANTDPDRTIVQAGPFTVTGHCQLNGGVQNFSRVFATTSENDAAADTVPAVGSENMDTDFDSTEEFTLSQYQESGTPPPPNGPRQAFSQLQSKSGTVVTLVFTEAKRLFGDNASEHTGCIFAGFGVIGTG
jgi:hypothetical protein